MANIQPMFVYFIRSCSRHEFLTLSVSFLIRRATAELRKSTNKYEPSGILRVKSKQMQ